MNPPPIISLGEILIDMLQDGKDNTILAEKFLALPGGAPANVAVGIAKLGVEVGFIGCVGNDHFGKTLETCLKEYQVDVSHLGKIYAARTTQAYILPGTEEKKNIFFYRNPGADQHLSPDHVQESYFKKVQFFHHGSISMIEEGPFEATLKAIQLTKKNGGLVSFDPNYRPDIWPSPVLAKERIWQGIELADIIKTSDEDLPFITDQDNIEVGAQHLLQKSKAHIVIITLAERGCYYLIRNGLSGYIDGFKIDFVEATGAGDAFSASILVDLYHQANSQHFYDLDQKDWIKILRNANATGALTATRKGAIPSMPTLEERTIFLKIQDRG